MIDPTTYERGKETADQGGHKIVACSNYGQGSSREHAALAPKFLGLKIALVKDFARIHLQNLINFGVLPLTFVNEEDHDILKQGAVLVVDNLKEKLKEGEPFEMHVEDSSQVIKVNHNLYEAQIELIKKGGVINQDNEELKNKVNITDEQKTEL